MRILAIDTSCDETAAAVTEGTSVLSNIVWSQASLHAHLGGVMPSLAQRQHEERIDWVIEKAIQRSGIETGNFEAIAVTVGPGLSIALGVGIRRAKELANEFHIPLIPVNHTEAHILSTLATPVGGKSVEANFPAFGLVISGGNTVFCRIHAVGKYEILAQTVDDALGEALDKAARMIGLGYPGGAVLEKMAKLGNPSKFPLTIPLAGQEARQIFSYSGLKTSFFRLIEKKKSENPKFPPRQEVYDLAAAFQHAAFTHLLRVVGYCINHYPYLPVYDFLLGGGVAANVEVRKRLRHLGKEVGFNLLTPYTKKLYGDNAAMIGVTAYIKHKNKSISYNLENIDRKPNLKITDGGY